RPGDTVSTECDGGLSTKVLRGALRRLTEPVRNTAWKRPLHSRTDLGWEQRTWAGAGAPSACRALGPSLADAGRRAWASAGEPLRMRRDGSAAVRETATE